MFILAMRLFPYFWRTPMAQLPISVDAELASNNRAIALVVMEGGADAE
jgi:hypothetical protein